MLILTLSVDKGRTPCICYLFTLKVQDVRCGLLHIVCHTQLNFSIDNIIYYSFSLSNTITRITE